MGLTWPEGHGAGSLFPSLLLGLSAKLNLDEDLEHGRAQDSWFEHHSFRKTGVHFPDDAP
jgi:hypothetical protein